VKLVPLGLAHKDRTRVWANDAELMRMMDRAQLVSEAEHDSWFEALARRDDCAYFAVELSGSGMHVGNVWLWNIDSRHRKAELRVVIGEAAARGKGAGTEAIDLLCQHGFTRMNLHRVYAYVLSSNAVAKRAFEGAGFAQEGILRDDRWAQGRFIDAYLFARVNR
jgi:RimJ/RimL family protein N-acetyltransferase